MLLGVFEGLCLIDPRVLRRTDSFELRIGA